MKRKYNIKVRTCGDYNAWEDIPLLSWGDIDWTFQDKEVEEQVELFFVENPDIVELRLNEKGSLQGHYFNNNKNRTEPHYVWEKGE